MKGRGYQLSPERKADIEAITQHDTAHLAIGRDRAKMQSKLRASLYALTPIALRREIDKRPDLPYFKKLMRPEALVSILTIRQSALARSGSST